MKLPRTGSSWFTQLLNDIPSVYIGKEIIQSGDLQNLGTDEMNKNNMVDNAK